MFNFLKNSQTIKALLASTTLLLAIVCVGSNACAQITTDRYSYEVGDTLKVLLSDINLVQADDIIGICKESSDSFVCHELWRTVNGSKIPDGTISEVIEFQLPRSLLPGRYEVNLQSTDGQIVQTVFFEIQQDSIQMDKISYSLGEDITAQYNLPMEKNDQFELCTPTELSLLENDCANVISVDEFASLFDYTPMRQGEFAVPATIVGTGDYSLIYRKDSSVLAVSESFSVSEATPIGSDIGLEAVSGETTRVCRDTWYEAPICASFTADSEQTICACGSSAGMRGIHVQVITQQGQVLPPLRFDLFYDSADLPKLQGLINYLANVQDGDAVLLSVADASFQGWMTSRPRTQAFYSLLEDKFFANKARDIVFRNSYAAVFVAGSAPLAEVSGGGSEKVVASAVYRFE